MGKQTDAEPHSIWLYDEYSYVPVGHDAPSHDEWADDLDYDDDDLGYDSDDTDLIAEDRG